MTAIPQTKLENWIEGNAVLPQWLEVQDSFIDEKPLMGGWIESVFRAWSDGSQIDPQGNIWLDANQLHQVIRVGSLVDLIKYCPGAHNSFHVEDRTLLRGTRVAKVIEQVIAKIDSRLGDRERRIVTNAEISKELYLLVRNSSPARRRQNRLYDSLHNRRADLKSDRTRKLRVARDELTGEGLRQAEFAYIRTPALYSELIGNIANGLVVNEATFDVIRRAQPADERELFQLCRKQNWSGDWYKGYRESLQKYAVA